MSILSYLYRVPSISPRGASAPKNYGMTVAMCGNLLAKSANQIREGVKIELIIFAELSAKGYPLPPLLRN